MTQRQYKILLFLFFGLLAAFIAYFFWPKKQKETCPDGSPLPIDGDCTEILAEYEKEGKVPPFKSDSKGCIQPTKYINNTYPLALGMKGTEIKKLQTALNSYFKAGLSVDGYLGCSGIAALIKATGKNTITEAELNSIATKTLPNPFFD